MSVLYRNGVFVWDRVVGSLALKICSLLMKWAATLRKICYWPWHKSIDKFLLLSVNFLLACFWKCSSAASYVWDHLCLCFKLKQYGCFWFQSICCRSGTECAYFVLKRNVLVRVTQCSCEDYLIHYWQCQDAMHDLQPIFVNHLHGFRRYAATDRSYWFTS